MLEVSTIGYTGYRLADFLVELRSHKVECLVDIRELPLSRKPGFSKSALRETLDTMGIDYLHLRQLGSPRALRHAVRADGDYAMFFRRMRAHLSTPVCTDAIEQLVDRMRRDRCCLMCCCADWSFCHRRAVVNAVNRKMAAIFDHITHKRGDEPKRRAA